MPEPTTLPGCRRPRVLVVDDDQLYRGAITRILSARCDVTQANSFADGLVALAQRRFDVVISDHDLGSTATGADLLTETRYRWPSVRRVLCSGDAPELRRTLGREVAQRILGKPPKSPEILECALASWLEGGQPDDPRRGL